LGVPGTPQAWYVPVDGRLPGDPGKAAEALLCIAGRQYQYATSF
jgi:hypothetical protein